MVKVDQVRELQISSEKTAKLINYIADDLSAALQVLKAKLETVTNPKHRFAKGMEHIQPIVAKCIEEFNTLINETYTIKARTPKLERHNGNKKHSYDTSSTVDKTPPPTKFYHHKRTGSVSFSDKKQSNTHFFVNQKELLQSILSIKTKLDNLSEEIKQVHNKFYESKSTITSSNEKALGIMINTRSKLNELSSIISQDYYPSMQPAANENMKRIGCDENLTFLILPKLKVTALTLENSIKEFLDESKALNTAFIAWADKQTNKSSKTWITELMNSIPEEKVNGIPQAKINKANIDPEVLVEQTDRELFHHYVDGKCAEFNMLNEFHLFALETIGFLSQEKLDPIIDFRKQLLDCYEATQIIIYNIDNFETMKSSETNESDLLKWLMTYNQILTDAIMTMGNCYIFMNRNSASSLLESQSIQGEFKLNELKNYIKFSKKTLEEAQQPLEELLERHKNEINVGPSTGLNP